MSEGMFLGRKFTIPYDNTADKQVASIARAQLATGTAAPGAVVQVGDTVMTYGVTPQQAKMGDLDIKLRSFEQISNQAQDVVRRNIQWQYGEQVGEVKKSWWRKLIGIPHTETTFKDLYPDSGGSALAPVKPGSTQAPAAASPAPASSRSASAVKQAPTKAAPKKTASAKPKASKPAASPATPSKKASQQVTALFSAEDRMPGHVEAHLTTAFHNFSRRHRSSRDASMWDVSKERPDGFSMVSVAKHKATNHIERHEFRYDPSSKQVLHRFTAAGKKDPVETSISLGEMTDKHGNPTKNWSPDDLYDYTRSSNDSWAF